MRHSSAAISATGKSGTVVLDSNLVIMPEIKEKEREMRDFVRFYTADSPAIFLATTEYLQEFLGSEQMEIRTFQSNESNSDIKSKEKQIKTSDHSMIRHNKFPRHDISALQSRGPPPLGDFRVCVVTSHHDEFKHRFSKLMQKAGLPLTERTWRHMMKYLNVC